MNTSTLKSSSTLPSHFVGYLLAGSGVVGVGGLQARRGSVRWKNVSIEFLYKRWPSWPRALLLCSLHWFKDFEFFFLKIHRWMNNCHYPCLVPSYMQLYRYNSSIASCAWRGHCTKQLGSLGKCRLLRLTWALHGAAWWVTGNCWCFTLQYIVRSSVRVSPPYLYSLVLVSRARFQCSSHALVSSVRVTRLFPVLESRARFQCSSHALFSSARVTRSSSLRQLTRLPHKYLCFWLERTLLHWSCRW